VTEELFHASEHSLRLLTENKIVALVFPVQTPNLFRVIDLVFFGAGKDNKDDLANEPDAVSIHEQICSASFTILSCFHQLDSQQTLTHNYLTSSFMKKHCARMTDSNPCGIEISQLQNYPRVGDGKDSGYSMPNSLRDRILKLKMITT
jgi:hypothetical protein